MKAAKAWAALVALIVATILSSNLIPISGTWHTILAVVSVIAGAFATWRIPNATDTPEVKQ